MIGVKAPKGAQLLYYPMEDCTISAGFKNARYKKAYGYPHYGVDFDSKRRVDFETLSSGNGTVIGVEKNKNSLGCVIVIQYDNVYYPAKNTIVSVIMRKYHSDKAYVRVGQKVKALQPIGKVSGDSSKGHDHDHTEFDLDTKYPFYTPQVSESASRMLVRKGANDKTMINPLDILVVNKEQAVKVHSMAIYADPIKDAPKYYEL